MKSKFLKFATSSFMGFLIDYALFCGLSFIFPDTKTYILLSNVAARVVSAICNYTINCRLVFKEKQTARSAVSYFLLAVFILCMNNVVLLIYSAIPGLSLYLAKIFTELTLFVTSYLIQKKVIFRNKFKQ
ncbi:GtrA family protein [Agathobacter sp.]